MPDFELNGKAVSVGVDPNMPLLWVLRDELNLTGTKFGCGIGACGACTVTVDGQAVRSCVYPVAAVAGRKINTIESGESDAAKLSAKRQVNVLNALQNAWITEQTPQCGYCQSGMLMAASALLLAQPKPTDDDIDQAMTNICRCGSYQRVRSAIHLAAETLSKGAA